MESPPRRPSVQTSWSDETSLTSMSSISVCSNTTMIALEEGWSRIEQQGVNRLKAMLSKHGQERGAALTSFPTKDAIDINTLIATMCHQPSPHNCSMDLYARYGQVLDQHLSEVVAPGIAKTCNNNKNMTIIDQANYLETVLFEWENFSFFAKWMKTLFNVLDRHVSRRKRLPTLRQVALKYFDEHILQPNEDMIHQAVLSLIQQDRNDNNTCSNDDDDETREDCRQLVTETCEFLDAVYTEMESLGVLLVPDDFARSLPQKQKKRGEDKDDNLHHRHHHHNHHPRTTKLEKLFWQATREFYAQQRQIQWKKKVHHHKHDGQQQREYLAWAKTTKEREQERSADYLYMITSERILADILHQELITKMPRTTSSRSLSRSTSTRSLSRKPSTRSFSRTSSTRSLSNIGPRWNDPAASDRKKISLAEYIPILGLLIKRRRRRKQEEADKSSASIQKEEHDVETQEDDVKPLISPESTHNLASFAMTSFAVNKKMSETSFQLLSTTGSSERSIASTEPTSSRNSSPARSVQPLESVDEEADEEQDEPAAAGRRSSCSATPQTRVVCLREKNKLAEENLQLLLGKSLGDTSGGNSRYDKRARETGHSETKLASLKDKHHANASKVQDLMTQLRRDGNNQLVEGQLVVV